MMVCNLRTSNSRNHEKSLFFIWELRSGNSRPKARLHKMPQVTNDSVLCAAPVTCPGIRNARLRSQQILSCTPPVGSIEQEIGNVLPGRVDGFADHCR